MKKQQYYMLAIREYRGDLECTHYPVAVGVDPHAAFEDFVEGFCHEGHEEIEWDPYVTVTCVDGIAYQLVGAQQITEAFYHQTRELQKSCGF